MFSPIETYLKLLHLEKAYFEIATTSYFFPLMKIVFGITTLVIALLIGFS